MSNTTNGTYPCIWADGTETQETIRYNRPSKNPPPVCKIVKADWGTRKLERDESEEGLDIHNFKLRADQRGFYYIERAGGASACANCGGRGYTKRPMSGCNFASDTPEYAAYQQPMSCPDCARGTLHRQRRL